MRKFNLFLLLILCLIFFGTTMNKGYSFEYSISGPKLVSSLKTIPYRIVIFDSKKKKIPVYVSYQNKTIKTAEITEEDVINLDLSSFEIKENQDITLEFKIGKDSESVVLKYVPDLKAILFTDKPLYQPGQTVRLKGIVFKNNKPFKEEVILTITDPKSNKIFYKKLNLINGAFFEEFKISDLVINGVYKVDLLLKDKIISSNTFEVKKYVLPKFKVDLKLADSPKSLQLGRTYKAKLSCAYFFGKKVSNASVRVDVFSFDVGFNKLYSIEGKTDNEGEFEFELKVPTYLVGVDKNKGILKIEVEVEDKANQISQKTLLFDVFKDPVEVYLLPSNKPTIKMNNKFYLFIRYADEQEGSFQVNFKKPFSKSFKTNGFLEFDYKPSSSFEKFVFDVVDQKGNVYNFEESTYFSDEKSVFIFRDRVIYNVGEKLKIGIYSNMSTRVYLDFFVKSDDTVRTVLTDSLYVESGRNISYETVLNPNFAGHLVIRAYFVKNDGTISSTYKSFIIQDPQELELNIMKNKDIYKVRDKLELDVKVSERSVVFVDIVDEALLYFAQAQPELLKLYLQLEKELLEAKYEIHKHESIKEPIIRKKEEILKIAFDGFKEEQSQNFGKFFNVLNSVEIKTRKTLEKMRKLYNKCYTYYNSFRKFPDDLKDLKNIGISKEDYLDAWGNEIRLVNRKGYIDLVSAGRDSKFGTEDDIMFQDVRVVRVAVQDTGPIMNLKKAENQISGRSESFPSKDDFLVRQYFPETFYSSLIQVDKNKKISLVLPDSITNWKAKFFAVSSNGKIGSKTLDITVFQEFFIDINNPLFLTQGDEISLPIVVYNYTKEDLKVKVKIEKEDWFDLLDEEVKSVLVKPNSPGNLYFRIKAKKAGINNLTVLAYGNRFKDAIKKDIEVLPNGFAVFNNNSAYVEKTGNFNFVIPSYAINDSYKVYLYLYPGFSSQVLGGLDKLLTVPYGCFEQTSSINYPNILILRYLRQKNISNPAIEMKAEYYLNIGYQRLLTFEVEGGGFSWFGDKPANKVLTAFGLMEFKDMKDVFFVDEKLIERTKQFLMSNQESDGGWQPDSNYLHAESWGKIQKQRITVTSYILMALLDNDKKIYDQYGGKIKKSLNLLYQNLKNNINEIDNYTLGLMLNVFADARDYERFSNEAIGLIIKELEKRAKNRGEEIYWKGTKTLFYGDDLASDIETTSLIGLAMIKLNKFDSALKIVKFLINSKDNRGIWYSTQPTILALKTIINFEEKSNTFSSQPKKVKISINGNENVVNFDKNDLAYKIIDLTSYVRKGENTVRIETDGSILFDLNYNFYLPFDRHVKRADILDINIRYDKSELSINDKVKVFAEVKNNTSEVLEMVVLDLGVPPGFSVDLSNLKSNPKVKNVESTNRQVIVYFDKIDRNEKINLEYEMIPKYPLKVKVLPSKAYEYYNPSKVVISEGKVLEVK